MIYTTYYSKLKHIPNEWPKFAISRTVPKGINIRKLPYLAPGANIFNEYRRLKNEDIGKAEEYLTTEYLKQLNSYVPEAFNDLPDNAVLICYEKGFCHRHILRTFLLELGLDIKEFDENEDLPC